MEMIMRCCWSFFNYSLYDFDRRLGTKTTVDVQQVLYTVRRKNRSYEFSRLRSKMKDTQACPVKSLLRTGSRFDVSSVLFITLAVLLILFCFFSANYFQLKHGRWLPYPVFNVNVTRNTLSSERNKPYPPNLDARGTISRKFPFFREIISTTNKQLLHFK